MVDEYILLFRLQQPDPCKPVADKHVTSTHRELAEVAIGHSLDASLAARRSARSTLRLDRLYSARGSKQVDSHANRLKCSGRLPVLVRHGRIC